MRDDAGAGLEGFLQIRPNLQVQVLAQVDHDHAGFGEVLDFQGVFNAEIGLVGDACFLGVFLTLGD